MSKRTLTALGAVLGTLLLAFGLQQAVVLTSAAWNDRVGFSAPVTSGTWQTSPAWLKKDFHGVMVDAGPILKVSVQISNTRAPSGSSGTVNTLSAQITLPADVLHDTAAISVPPGWELQGSPVLTAGNTTIEFRRTTALALDNETGPVDFKIPLVCARGKKFPLSASFSSPEAANVLAFDTEAHILGWTC